jgi:hypothetical protein
MQYSPAKSAPCSGLGRAPEELQLDVVWIAEGEHRINCIGRLLDARVAYSKLVQPGRPDVEVTPLGNQELQVIQPRAELVKGTWVRAVINQAELQAAAWQGEADLGGVTVGLDIAAGFQCAEQTAVPASAAVGVADREDDDLADDVGHGPTLTGGCWAGKSTPNAKSLPTPDASG